MEMNQTAANLFPKIILMRFPLIGTTKNEQNHRKWAVKVENDFFLNRLKLKTFKYLIIVWNDERGAPNPNYEHYLLRRPILNEENSPHKSHLPILWKINIAENQRTITRLFAFH